MSEMLTGDAFTEKFNILKQEGAALTQRINRANAKLDERKSSHAAVEQEALSLFGTKDPEQLRTELSRREQENHTRLSTYEKEIEDATTKVTALENALTGNADESA